MFAAPRAAVSRKNRCWLLAVVLSVCAGIFTVHKGAGAAPQGEVESPMGRSGALGVPILSLRSLVPVDACAPSGRLQFVCGPKNVEDLVLVPHTHWIIAGGLMAAGRLHLSAGPATGDVFAQSALGWILHVEGADHRVFGGSRGGAMIDGIDKHRYAERVSDSRMNSWRVSLHICPARVRKLIAANHSACVGSISRMKAWA